MATKNGSLLAWDEHNVQINGHSGCHNNTDKSFVLAFSFSAFCDFITCQLKNS